MKFRLFIFRKCRFIFKLILSFAILNFFYLMRFPRKQSPIHETHTALVQKQVLQKNGLSFHMFGEENEIQLAIPIWEMTDIDIHYYVARDHNATLSHMTPDYRNSSIIYYENKNQLSFNKIVSLITEHDRSEGQWGIILNPKIVVNRTALMDELSKYRWYYPVMLTYEFGRKKEHLDRFDSYNYELIILSASMIEILRSGGELMLDGIGEYWTKHYIHSEAIVTNSVCVQAGQDCGFLRDSILYKVASLDLLPHVFLLLIRGEKRTKDSLLTDAGRKFDTAITKIPYKYLHEARELYDREMEWGRMETAEWKRTSLPQECKQLGAVPRPECYLTSLVEESMPIVRHGGVWEWRVVEAYAQFSLEGGEEYLVWLEKREGHHFLFRFMGAVDVDSGEDLLRPIEQVKLLIIQSGDLDPDVILQRYQALLEEQEVHLTTTRHPILFTIDLALLLNQHTDDKLAQKLNKIKLKFPEIETEVMKGEITSHNLLQIISQSRITDILGVNILSGKLNYRAVERCFSLASLELSMVSDSEGGTCVAVGDAIRILKHKSIDFSFESFPNLSEMKILRIPLSIKYDEI